MVNKVYQTLPNSSEVCRSFGHEMDEVENTIDQQLCFRSRLRQQEKGHMEKGKTQCINQNRAARLK